MSVYRMDDKGRIVSIDGEVMVPTTTASAVAELEAALRRFGSALRAPVEAFLREVEGVQRSQDRSRK